MCWRAYCNGPVLAVIVMATVMVIGSLAWSPDPGDPPPAPPREPSPPEISSEAKCQIARRLAAREITLLVAAAAIREIDCNSPHFDWDSFRRAYPDAINDDERHCREAVEWFLAVSPDDAATAERVREWNDEIDRAPANGISDARDGAPALPQSLVITRTTPSRRGREHP